MKTLLKIIFLTIITSLMLSSCKQLSVIKRKYTKGYYIDYTNKKTDVKNHSDIVANDQKPEVLKPVAITSLPTENSSDKKEYEPVASIKVPENVNKHTGTIASIKDHGFSKEHFKLITQNPIKLFNDELSYKMGQDPARKALSLLWVIIVVILIIYLIGLLFDSYGIGLAIHLLALIALILLILWLLRIL